MILFLVFGVIIMYLYTHRPESKIVLPQCVPCDCRGKTGRYPVVVRESRVAGRGVFATRFIRKGELIEICPTIVGQDQDVGKMLRDYHFATDDGQAAIALGYCSLFNHSDDPSGYWRYSRNLKSIIITAHRNIEKDEEITISYGSGYWKRRPHLTKKTE